MSKSIGSPRRGKPKKPRSAFPFFLHATSGRTKIRVKRHDFGEVSTETSGQQVSR